MESIADINKKLFDLLQEMFDLPPKVTYLRLEMFVGDYPKMRVDCLAEPNENIYEKTHYYQIEKVEVDHNGRKIEGTVESED